ncbi:MAG: FxLYD domain-containing protein [bacterium]|nr:FxLYD domain-containing protein [bacterium]
MTTTVTRGVCSLVLAALLLSACSGGTVQFIEPAAEDTARLALYTHPAGVFTLHVPRGWAVYEQNAVTLASAAFSAPDDPEPPLRTAVIDLGVPLDAAALEGAIARYQTQIRTDAPEYVEQNRARLADGSWQIAGYRTSVRGDQTINTFFQAEGTRLAVTEVTAPPDGFRDERRAQIEQIVNSLRLIASAPLEPTDLEALAFAASAPLTAVHISAWTAGDGALFITGEVANTSGQPVPAVPVDIALVAADGTVITGAVDYTLGYGIMPGGFAPFSLRFGEGQPINAADTLIQLRDAAAAGQVAFSAPDELTWTDSSRFDAAGGLVITGTVTNGGSRPLGGLRALATVFAADGRVIGAAQADLDPSPLLPGETRPFEIAISAFGGVPQNYIVTVQGIP